ncbi:MAG: DnaA/Hda family protein [Pacificimonas sp.]
MTEQIALPLGQRDGSGEARFFIGDANRDAAARLDLWEGWPDRAAILLGPEGAGKSHLARLTVARARGAMTLLEDIDRDPPEDAQLFHMLNRARNGGEPLLLTARALPKVALADLASRLRALPLLTIAEPDDVLLVELIGKELAARGLRVGPDVISFIAQRIERRYKTIQDTAARIDAAALAAHRSVTIPLVKTALFEE